MNIRKEEVIIPNIHEQQIILICKGHSKNKNSIDAIRNILAQQFKLKTKYVEYSVIYRWLIKCIKKYANYKHIISFTENLFERKNEITIIDAIKDLISILANIDVIDKNGKELIKLKENRKLLDWIE